MRQPHEGACLRAAFGGLTGNLAHPGISPTNLLAAQPGLGRDRTPVARRLIGLLSSLRIVGTVESAAQPAIVAATSPDARGDQFWGPRRTVGGPPTLLPLWAPLTDMDTARRLWDVSEELTGVRVGR